MTVQRKLHWLWFEQPPNQVAGLESKFHTTLQTDEDTLAEQLLTQVYTNAALDKMANCKINCMLSHHFQDYEHEIFPYCHS